MLRVVLCCLLLLAICPVRALAEGRLNLGWGRLITNDSLVDGQDRWRTGSYTLAWLRGPAWTGTLPGRFGELIELRFHGEIVTPANLTRPAAGDRRFAGILSLGAHTHFERFGFEVSTGAGLVLTGPATRLDRFQERVHRLIGITGASDPVRANQIPDHVYPTLRLEVGRKVPVTPRLTFRPYFEALAGVETLLRAGADLHLGTVGQSDLYLRDSVTGQRFRANRGKEPGLGLILGVDAGHVFDSYLLPAADGYRTTDVRLRARTGVLWQGRRASVYYGLTWLGPEFEAQPEGQFVGSLQLGIRF